LVRANHGYPRNGDVLYSETKTESLRVSSRKRKVKDRWIKPLPAVIRSYVISDSDVLEGIRTLRVSARGGACPGHFYADALRRAFGIQIEATSLSTKRETVQELLVPVQALKASTQSPVNRRASVCYEPFIGQRLASASRVAERKVQTEKLPAVLRGVGACQLRYAVCCGALFVFEVLWGDSRPLRKGALLISCHGNTSTLIKSRSCRGNYLSLLSEVTTHFTFTTMRLCFHKAVEVVGGIMHISCVGQLTVVASKRKANRASTRFSCEKVQ